MTPEQFVIWLKGFAEAANSYNITPKQWEELCEELSKVEVTPLKATRYSLDNTNWNTSTTAKDYTQVENKIL
jgi:hypothetical protein